MNHLLVIALAAGTLSGADATGTWTGTLTRSGDATEPLPAYLVLKQEGEQLTGTAGPNAGEQQPIHRGKAENGVLTFEVTTGESVMKFAVKQDGDEITGDVTREREGQTQRAKLAVKRTP